MNASTPTHPRRTNQRAAALRDAAGRAFTLMEVIVAVAAVALVAVGLASIFDAVGKTVNGGKRVSLLNQYAGLIENQMRKDFSEMTRDGFLVIRQQHIDNNGGGAPDGVFTQVAGQATPADLVKVSATDERPRSRRADEVIFFARGEFQTNRSPIHPEAVVTSDAAMIYYGHGQRRRDDAVFTDPAGGAVSTIYAAPRTDDTNADNTAKLGIGSSAANPNLYAGDWTLLRKQVLLVKPNSGQAWPIPSAVTFVNPATGATRRLTPNPNDVPPPNAAELARIANTNWQIALQPAAASVFRSLNRYFPRDTELSNPNIWFRDPRRSNLASGIVDIAATDLAEIKSIVQGLGMGWDATNQEFLAQTPALPRSFDPTTTGSGIILSDYIRPFTWSHPFPSPAQTATTPAPSTPPPSSVELMQVWMNEAFPTESAAGPRWGRTNALSNISNGGGWDPPGVRPRSEPEPVDLISVIAGNLQTTAAQGGTDGVQATYERADQLMLVASNFLPRCSEFAVDWSFGQVDPDTNELIWHGPPTRFDSDGNGVVDATDAYSLLPYPFNASAPTANPDAYQNPGTRIAARDAGWYKVAVPRLPYLPPTDALGNPSAAKPFPYMDKLPHEKLYYDHVVSDRLIYGYRAWQPGQPVQPVLTSYFGFADPTYKQDIIYIQDQLTWNRLTGNDLGHSPADPPDLLSDGRLTPGMQIDRGNNGFVGTTNGVTISASDVDLEMIPGEPAPASIPWAWPKMVRVTVTLSDALDPTIENTFQFIFNVAPDPAMKK